MTYSGPELCALTARAAVALLRKGSISPDELISASVARVAQTGPAINATVTLCETRARGKAAAVSRDSLLAGLPVGIKDLNPVAGVRTTWGTPGLADHVPTVSDPMVERIEARGGVVIGKTNTPEMGAGANTFNAVFGATRNPWDTRMNAGGSSGGAAASLAVGEAWLSHGSDFGGSLRTPASFCGIVGLRPSPGVAGGPDMRGGFVTLPAQGPMARNVADVALFLDAMSGYADHWPTAYPAPEVPYLQTCLADPGPMRLAFAPDLGGLAPVTAEMDGLLRAALTRLVAPDLHIDEAAPVLDDVDQTFRVFRALGMWSAARATPDAIKAGYKPTLTQNIAEGAALTVDQIADAEPARAAIFLSMRDFMQSFDALACPVTGLGPLPVEIEYPTEVAGQPCRDYVDWLRYSFVATLSGLPALVLPVGVNDQGLPVGIQLIGKPRGEGRLLQVARAMEERLALPPTPIDPVVRH